jgi:hypothetical protein
MNKQSAHFQAFGYEPLRMKPAHFASGFFIALTGEVFENQLLNQVAVIHANKGLLEDYRSEVLTERLKADGLIVPTMQQAAVELLRVQVNGVVNNDDAMYPAFKPYRPKGNDYTFISRRVLTIEDRTDGFAGFFVASVLGVTKVGRTVLQVGRALAAEPARTLEHLIEPLIAQEDARARNLKDQYESRFGELSSKRLKAVATLMEAETTALSRLCRNAASYSHYKRVRFYVIGLLAWLMNYLIKTSAGAQAPAPLMFFDFSGVKEGRTRIQSKACYARLREIVGQFYRKFANEGRFNPDPIAAQLFNKRNKHNQVLADDYDFAFLETHFSDLALRMGYAQPRSSRVNEKHLELQPDTLRVLMLSVLNEDPQDALPFDELCRRLADIWRVVVGGNADDLSSLRAQGYFGFDEEDLRDNAGAFTSCLKSLNLAVEPSDGLVLSSTEVGGIL